MRENGTRKTEVQKRKRCVREKGSEGDRGERETEKLQRQRSERDSKAREKGK